MRIVELSAFVAAPLAGATLASLGAEVIRIDPPAGPIDANRWPLHNGRSLYWAGLNQGKKSVLIDTRSEAGRELVTALIAKAGAVLTNLPVREWNAYERLSENRPDLIMAILTGNADGSPAVDYTVNAATGFPFVTGPEGHVGPVNHVLPAWDALAGYMLTTAMVAAELYRLRTGAGQCIRLSLSDVALSIAGHLGLIAEAQLDPEPRPRIGNELFGTFARDFRTSDGKYVIAVALTPDQWRNLVAATGIGDAVARLEAEHGVDLREEGAKFELRKQIAGLLEPWIAARPLAAVREEFDRHHVLWGPYQTFKELAENDPRCSGANPMFAVVDQPEIGRYLRAASPLLFSGSERLSPRPSPDLGEHTAEVIGSWLGQSRREIQLLEAKGVAKTAG